MGGFVDDEIDVKVLTFYHDGFLGETIAFNRAIHCTRYTDNIPKSGMSMTHDYWGQTSFEFIYFLSKMKGTFVLPISYETSSLMMSQVEQVNGRKPCVNDRQEVVKQVSFWFQGLVDKTCPITVVLVFENKPQSTKVPLPDLLNVYIKEIQERSPSFTGPLRIAFINFSTN